MVMEEKDFKEVGRDADAIVVVAASVVAAFLTLFASRWYIRTGDALKLLPVVPIILINITPTPESSSQFSCFELERSIFHFIN
jgi:hypothetical protein